MKKFIRSRLSILAAVCILVSLFGCSANDNGSPESEQTQPSETESTPPITQITADGEIPRPSPGTVVPTTELTLPEDAPYSVECKWYACAKGDDTALEPGQEFGPDIEYYIRLSFTLDEAVAQQHAFAENVKLKLNAEALNPTSYAPDRVEFEKAFYVGDAIWFVDIFLDDPVEGSIPMPAVSGEEIFSISSYCSNFGESIPDVLDNNKKYPLIMVFEIPRDSDVKDFIFLEHSQLRINGILAEDLGFYETVTRLDYESGRKLFYVGLDHAPGYTPNRVEYVSLDGYPELKIEVGSPAPGPIEDTLDYRFASWTWYENTESGYATRDDIIFEDGKAYKLSVQVLANHAFYFPEDIQCFFEGYHSEWTTDGDLLTLDIYVSFGEEELTPISAIDLTLYEPKAGDPATDITVPTVDSSFCTVEEWGIYEQAGYGLEPVTGVFEADIPYAYTILLAPDPGYYFPEDIAVTVNGKQVSLSCSFINGKIDIFYEPEINNG